MKNEKKRMSLSFRCRKSPNHPLIKVLDWLNNLDAQDKQENIERLLFAFLPYAFEAKGKTKEEVKKCYWDVHQRLQDYLFVMRQTLNIQVPTTSFNSDIRVGTNANFLENTVSSGAVETKEETKETEVEETRIEEEGFSHFDSIF